MRTSEKNLKAVIEFLNQLAARGDVEQSLKEAMVSGIAKLRQAGRTRDSVKMWKAVDVVARVFLKSKKW